MTDPAASTPAFFVNLPLRYIHRDRTYLDLFMSRGLHPELGLDVWAMEDRDESWHKGVADALQRAGLHCAVHLPFFDLQPGSLDTLILSATRQRLAKAVELAQLYTPRHMVAHAAFNEMLYSDFFSSWVSRASQTWREVLHACPDHPPLYLENTMETEPGPLSDLMGELWKDRVGFCFDVGHWHSFGRGSRKQDLGQWLVTMRPHLKHLHLHDNDGSGDQHLGLGQGSIPLAGLFQGLEALGLTPTVTLEPHSREDLEHSLVFLARLEAPL